MQARTLLAIVATLQLGATCLNFTLAAYVIWLTLPFAAIAFIGVFIAIYCGWRTGIWIFIGTFCFRHLSPNFGLVQPDCHSAQISFCKIG